MASQIVLTAIELNRIPFRVLDIMRTVRSAETGCYLLFTFVQSFCLRSSPFLQTARYQRMEIEKKKVHFQKAKSTVPMIRYHSFTVPVIEDQPPLYGVAVDPQRYVHYQFHAPTYRSARMLSVSGWGFKATFPLCIGHIRYTNNNGVGVLCLLS